MKVQTAVNGLHSYSGTIDSMKHNQNQISRLMHCSMFLFHITAPVSISCLAECSK